jgi:hypothetical protein
MVPFSRCNGFVSVSERKWRAMQAIKSFFDAVDLITTRLPSVDRLIVELILIGFIILGGYTIFKIRQKNSWVDSGSGSLPSE